MKSNKKICAVCGNEEYIWSNKTCKSCYLQKQNYKIKSRKDVKNDNVNYKLITFFKYHLDYLNNNYTVCANCKEPIYNGTTANIAHILPKNIFKSVENDLNNCIYLCIPCHSTFDSSFERAKNMECFALAKEKYNIFLKHKIVEERDFLKYFNE